MLSYNLIHLSHLFTVLFFGDAYMGKVTTVYVDKSAYEYLREYYKMTLTTMIDQVLYFINYDETKLMKIVRKYGETGKDKMTVSMPLILHYYIRTISNKYGVNMSAITNAILKFLEQEGFGGVVNL